MVTQSQMIHIEVPADDVEAVVALVRTHFVGRGYKVERAFHHIEVTRPPRTDESDVPLRRQ